MSRHGIDVQAKSSTLAQVDEGNIVHDFEVRSYNDLCDTAVGAPRVLVLLVLPENEAEWMTLSEEMLVLRQCAYWLSLKGAPPSDNVSRVRIRIPRTQVLSAGALKELMNRVREGESL